MTDRIMETPGKGTPVLAGIELGGTKAVLVVARGRHIIDRIMVPTSGPDETLGGLRRALEGWMPVHRPEALGIASFGPVCVTPDHADFGRMLDTPKAGWTGADIAGAFAGLFSARPGLHTDVTGAALAEGRWGAAQGRSDYVYVTIGTGIGMGIIAGGKPVSGEMHPEAGHLRVRRMAGDDFPGICPFHGDCLEGLASGPAVAARAGVPGNELPPDSPHWGAVVDAIAEGFVSLLVTLAPSRIIIGGGVGLGQDHLLPRIRAATADKLNGYLPFFDREQAGERIVAACLGADAGPLGATILAEESLAARHP